MCHFEHGSSLVIAPDGQEFFVDAACTSLNESGPEDWRVAQALCGFAFDMGRAQLRAAQEGFSEALAWSEGLDSVEREIEAQEAKEAA